MLRTTLPTLDAAPQGAPLGANLLTDGSGASFRTWAPAAREVRLRWGYARDATGSWSHREEARLGRLADGTWSGLVPGLQHGERYMFYVVGPPAGSEGLKRDPRARDLSDDPAWPHCQCLLSDPARFRWHDAGFRPPPFHELILYQFHVGTWHVPDGMHHGTFLGALEKLPHLVALGINAVQPLPIVEFPTMFSLGYNGVDYFSPETDYGIAQDDPALDRHLALANRLLHDLDPQLAPYTCDDVTGTGNQLRMLVDLLHLHGIAVVLDVVYNHAGGDFGDAGLYFYDRQPHGDQNDSLYFTDRGWAGGLVFAYWKDEVKQFLIDNARFYLHEYHVDGFRYDEVSVIRNEGGEHGWRLCQYVTDTCRFARPQAIHIAEHWPVDEATVRASSSGGGGFDAALSDGLREAVRGAIAQAAGGAGALVDMSRVARELASTRLGDAWRAVQCIENHDIVYRGRAARVPRLADGSDSRSWYARSRSRVALALVLTAPGIPHLFMGQELLEDEQWQDDPRSAPVVGWDRLASDRAASDFLRFTRDLVALRRRYRSMCGSGINVFHVHDRNRVLAFHRWVPGEGGDVVVVASLDERTRHRYRIGFPVDGRWREVFNSDAYDHWPNPWVAGSGGSVDAAGAGLHGLPASAGVVLPANGIVVFARE